jgi:hypothetical protein
LTAQATRLCGEDWQRWANKLLTAHYGPTEYQTVADNYKGDAGIEGYTFTAGHAFQAYGCEEPIGTKQRFEAQRGKMTRDINKFIANATTLEKIFGSVKISRWTLFVPYFDSKEIVAHATKKTAEVVAANLPYVSEKFHVVVCHEEDFALERDKLLNSTSHLLKFLVASTSEKTMAEWKSSNQGLAATLLEKIAKLKTLPNEQSQRKFHGEVLRWYLDGQMILDALRNYPDIYEKVIQAKAHRENFLAMASLSGSTPQDIFISTVKDLTATFKEDVRELHAFSAESLSHEAVADWLLRCPLDF